LEEPQQKIFYTIQTILGPIIKYEHCPYLKFISKAELADNLLAECQQCNLSPVDCKPYIKFIIERVFNAFFIGDELSEPTSEFYLINLIGTLLKSAQTNK
jgi:hypothetical protein